jgi:hypothetical protein
MKHPNIFATQIAAVAFYTPPPAYGETLAAVPALDEANIPQVGALQGDVGPDFTELDKKFGGATEPEVIKAADPTAILPETPNIPQEPVKPTDPAEKPPETPPASPETPKVPEVKPADAGAKPEFDAEAAAKKLDELAINPKASASTKEGFQNLKTITAEAVTTVKSLREKVAELEKRGGMTPELEAEVKALREFRDTWGAEHDPDFLKPFNERLTKADEEFVTSLQTNAEIKLPATDAEASMFADEEKTLRISAETLKRVGIDSPQGQQITNQIFAILQKSVSPLTYNKALRSFEKRDDIINERNARIGEVKAKQGGYAAAQEEKQKAEMQGYGHAADQKLIKLFAGAKWAEQITPAPDATPEAKANADAHNKWLKEGLVPEVRKYIGAIWNRDPDEAMVAVYKAVAHDQIAKERDALAAEKTQLEARVAELTKTAQGVRQIAAAPTKQAVAPTPKEPTKLDQTSDEAIDNFLASRTK